MKLGPEYFRIIAHFERGKANDPKCRLTVSGAALDAYLCPASVPTIGAGSIRRLDGSPVQMGDTITEAEVFLLAERDAEEAADAVRKIKRPLTQNQFDGLTAFTHNLGAGNLAKLMPLIEEGRWEDVAEKMSEYVRAWGKYNGRWYYKALLGLRIRRFSEGLLILGLEWKDVCDPDDIAMPKGRPPEWQPNGTAKDGTKGRYFDVLLPGATQFSELEARATRLAAPVLDLTPSMQAQPPLVATTRVPEAAGAEAVPAQPAQPQSSPKVSPAPTVPPASAEKQAPAIPAPSVKPGPAPVPPVGGVIVTKPPLPPLPVPPPPRDPLPADLANGKDMLLSRRFWGLFITGAGSLQFLPRGVTEWMNHENNRELLSWLAVVVFGIIVYQYGKRKATRPLK